MTGDEPSQVSSLENVQRALGTEFQIIRVLGSGTMATVYLARERDLDRMVAIKVLRPESADLEIARRRFEREARAAASLSHHHVVKVHRFGRFQTDGTPYLVMEFVNGRTMEEHLAAQGPLPIDTVVEVLADVASALAAVHARGIVHRDVRPANILWDEENEEALLTDFGIAALLETSGKDFTKLTARGMLVGDPRYISPEQSHNKPLTSLADVYSFGVLGYELLSGQSPYAATTEAEWLDAHRHAQPRDLRVLRSDIDRELATLLRQCLSKEPKHRPSAAALAKSLSDRTGRPAVPPQQRVWKSVLSRRVPQAIVGSGIVCWGLVEVVSTLIQNTPLPPIAFSLTLALASAVVAASGVVAWYHGQPGTQRPPLREFVLLGALAVAWIGVSIILLV
jgi:serine/threonine-protein kinase